MSATRMACTITTLTFYLHAPSDSVHKCSLRLGLDYFGPPSQRLVVRIDLAEDLFSQTDHSLATCGERRLLELCKVLLISVAYCFDKHGEV